MEIGKKCLTSRALEILSRGIGLTVNTNSTNVNNIYTTVSVNEGLKKFLFNYYYLYKIKFIKNYNRKGENNKKR